MNVTVLRPGGRDRHGDPIPGTSFTVVGCVISPRRASGPAEDNDLGETVIVGYTLYAPYAADIRATDQVQITDPGFAGTFDVVGEPGSWQNPFTGDKAGKEVALIRHG